MPGAPDRTSQLGDALRRSWRHLRDYDPWKVRLVDRGREAFNVSWSGALSATMWIGGVLLGLAAVLAVQAVQSWSLAWLLPLVAAGAVLGIAMAWRTPTFEADPEFSASQIRPGLIYCGDRRRNSRGEDEASNEATVVVAVFKHHGAQAKPMWVALADGTMRSFAFDATTKIISPQDNFERWRTPRTVSLDYPEPPSPNVVELLAHVWDASGNDPPRVSVVIASLGWPQQRAQQAIANAERLKFIQVHERGRLTGAQNFMSLTDAGRIYLAQEKRNDGLEIFLDAKAPNQKSTVTNFGNMNYNSPGSAINTGSGSANVNVTIDELTFDNLTTLADSADAIAYQVDATDAGLIRDAAAEMRRELARPDPDGGRLKRAARTVIRAGGSVGLGVVGNGVWEGLKIWAGIQ